MFCRLCHSQKEPQEVFHLENTLIDGVYGNTTLETCDFTLVQCHDCWLFQLKELVDYNRIYSNYKFSSSNVATISHWMESLHKILVENYNIQNKTILEIGASDGCFLTLFQKENSVYGIEPSKILTEIGKEKYGVDIVHGYYTKESFKGMKFDFIICRHVLEHIEDSSWFIDTMTSHLSEEWLLYIEVPDMDHIIEKQNYTNFFHEHINYFSKEVLERYMWTLWFESVFHIKNKVHNWSFWMIFKHKTQYHVSELNHRVLEYKETLDSILKKYKNIVWYGAANKTFKLLSMFDLDSVINIILDVNKNLSDTFIFGKNKIFIQHPEKIRDIEPDAIIIFATSYSDEIVYSLRNTFHYNGDIILLYPEIHVISWK